MKKYSRFQRLPVQFDDINFRNNAYVGFTWPIVSTRTGETYDVMMTNSGFSCTCIGFQRHGKCKHIDHVHNLLVADEYPVYKTM